MKQSRGDKMTAYKSIKKTNVRSVTEVDAIIGRRINDLRQLRGLSQTALARGVKLSFQQIQKYESGKNRIVVSRLLDLCRVLEVDMDYFLDDLDNNDFEGGLGIGVRLTALDEVTHMNLYRNLSKNTRRTLNTMLGELLNK